MRGLKLGALICASTALFVQAAPNDISPQEKAPTVDIRQSGFVYCVNGVIDSFNPQIANGGVLVDTIAAQLYDRLLDVDPTPISNP